MKQITLTKGMFALVDDDDYDSLNQFKWHVFKTPYTYYARRDIWIDQKVIHILMHREIMNTPKGMVCDHAFHNGLDNRKFIEIDGILKPNLRNCSYSDDQRNKKPIGKSKYMGVYFNNLTGNKLSIQAAITINKKRIYLGVFETEELAAKAYDKAAKEYNNEFANLNFK